MHTWLIERLECPSCHGGLEWTVNERDRGRIDEAVATCRECDAAYPVRQGIGLFLTPDLPREDLWEQAGSQLVEHLQAHPDVERQLMESPADDLGPADLTFRSMVLEERGDYHQARALEERALAGMYTPEYRACWERQTEYVVEALAGSRDAIVDLASGRGYLAEEMAQRLNRPVVVTDFSPRVLRRDRAWWTEIGLYEQVSLLAFDARHTPFQDRSVPVLTTNLGLHNVEQPGDLLQELRRIVDGRFLVISHFYPEDDEVNLEAARELELIASRREAMELLAEAGWEAEVVNVCQGPAQPTPESAVLEGARIDVFPVAETTLEWCVVEAR
jgi:SAM-dependent methyltransferase/uncharacterized protein YbaR (Trm112 family)